jgi:hypothetical protein
MCNNDLFSFYVDQNYNIELNAVDCKNRGLTSNNKQYMLHVVAGFCQNAIVSKVNIVCDLSEQLFSSLCTTKNINSFDFSLSRWNLLLLHICKGTKLPHHCDHVINIYIEVVKCE